MGQEPSNIALEVALATKPNYTILAEEVEANNVTLAGIVKDIADMVEERANRGLNYGRFADCPSLPHFGQRRHPRGSDRVHSRAQAAAP
jgi:hypothetical protein